MCRVLCCRKHITFVHVHVNMHVTAFEQMHMNTTYRPSCRSATYTTGIGSYSLHAKSKEVSSVDTTFEIPNACAEKSTQMVYSRTRRSSKSSKLRT